MADFVDRHDLGHLDHIIDADGSLWAAFGVVSQPSWAFIDDDGTTEVRFGLLGERGLHDRMDALASS